MSTLCDAHDESGAMADFYVDIFGFERVASANGDPTAI